MNRVFLQILISTVFASGAPSWVYGQSDPVTDKWTGASAQKIFGPATIWVMRAVGKM